MKDDRASGDSVSRNTPHFYDAQVSVGFQGCIFENGLIVFYRQMITTANL